MEVHNEYWISKTSSFLYQIVLFHFDFYQWKGIQKIKVPCMEISAIYVYFKKGLGNFCGEDLITNEQQLRVWAWLPELIKRIF